MAGNTQIKLRQILQDGATNNSNVIRWNTTEWIAAILDSTAISDFNEAAQDAVGLMVDANSLVYTDATPLLAVKQQMSITSDASGVKLSGDTASPGNNKIYGTNGSGTKGWFDSPSGADGNGIYTGDGTIGAGVAASYTTATMPSGSSTFVIESSGGDILLQIINDNDTQLRGPVSGGNNALLHLLGDATVYLGTANGGGFAITETATESYSSILFNTSSDFSAINTKAAVELRTTDSKALLLPRMTTSNFNTFSAAGGGVTADGMMLYNTDTDTIKLRANGAWIDLAAAGGLLTASNGLTAVGTEVKLGGTLTANTTIDNDDIYQLLLTGQRASGALLDITNSATGSAANGLNVTTNGSAATALVVTSTESGLAGSFTTLDSNDNIATVLQLNRNVNSGTGAVGTGVRLTFAAETTTTTSTLSNTITSEWTTATHAGRTSKLIITGVNSGTEANKLEIAGTGAIRLNDYGDGTFTGTPTRTLQVDTNGNIIENATVNFESTLTFSNGLTRTANSVKLGGALVDATTTITGDATNYLIITGARTVSTNASLHVNNTGASGSAIKTLASGTGAGVWGESTTGTGVYGTSAGPGLGSYTTGTVATYSQIETSGTTDVLTTLKLDRLTTNTAGNGLGSKILFTNETSTTPLTEANSIVSKWSNAIHAARLAEFSITGYNIGTENTLLTLLGTGAARLNQYGATGFTGTPTRTLQVDSSGNIIQNSTVTLGNGIYGGSGDIQNNTVATLVTGGDFTIDYFGGTDAIRVDDATSSVYLQSKNGTADFSVTNTGILSTFSTANTLSEVLATQVRLAYDDGGSAPQQFIVDSTGAYMTSATKMLRPPSMTTAQRTGGTLTETGGFVYDTTLNKMYFRDNSTFIEIANGAAGFGGIYKGSGTIAPATAATVTANSTFVIYYSNLTDAIGISDSGTGLLAIKNRAGNKAITLADTKIELVSSGGSIAYKIDNNGLTGTSSPILIDYTGLGASNHSGLELRATDKLFYTSRMSTAERDALTPTTGAIVYNNTTNKFNFWETAWVQYMVDAAGVGGIYKGSGTIAPAAVAIATANSNFKMEYAGGSDAFFLDSTTGAEELTIQGSSSNKGIVTVGQSSVEIYAGSGIQGMIFTDGQTEITSNVTKINKAFYRTGVITPALITANQNNYDLGDSGTATYARMSTDASRDITGIAGGVAGREIVLINIGTQNIILKSDSASSSPTNRMLMRNATDTTLLPAQCITLWYDDPGSNARWRVTSGA